MSSRETEQRARWIAENAANKSPVVAEVLKGLDWLTLTAEQRKKERPPDLTPLPPAAKAAVALTLLAHEKEITVCPILAREMTADAEVPRPVLHSLRLDHDEDDQGRRWVTHESIVKRLAEIIKRLPSIGVLDSYRFRAVLVMSLQSLPERDGLRLLRVLLKRVCATPKKRERRLHLMEVDSRIRHSVGEGLSTREAVKREAQERGLPVSTVLGGLQSLRRDRGGRIQPAHERPKKRRTN